MHSFSKRSDSVDHCFTEVESDLSEMMREAGLPLMVVHHDAATGEVLCSKDGGPFVHAHGEIKAMVTGEPRRDPGLIDPQTASKAEIRSMLLYLVANFRPDLTDHPCFGYMVSGLINALSRPGNREILSSLENNYQRWDSIVDTLVSIIDGIDDMND